MTDEERMLENRRISDLIRAQTLRNLEATARINTGWRSWMPPLWVALILWGSGAAVGYLLTMAIVTH